jgi:hypothetical protein
MRRKRQNESPIKTFIHLNSTIEYPFKLVKEEGLFTIYVEVYDIPEFWRKTKERWLQGVEIGTRISLISHLITYSRVAHLAEPNFLTS